MSVVRVGKSLSEYTRAKMSSSKAGENNPMFGRALKKHPMFGRALKKHPMFGKYKPEGSGKLSKKNRSN